MNEAEQRSERGPGVRLARGNRYTRVAIFLHWAIAAMILYNLLLGFFNWNFGHDFTHAPERRWLYRLILVSHMSTGLTVLALTVLRIAWRLLHEPPAYSPDMKRWERHLAHVAHFFLYGAMVLMPLTGWAILSANPPPGSEGAKARDAALAAMPPPPGTSMGGRPSGGPPGGTRVGGGPPGGGPQVWWVLGPMPPIVPIRNIGVTAGGYAPQKVLHDELAEWHKVGAWLTVLLLSLHVAGALKHQILDRQPSLSRMGIGRESQPKPQPSDVMLG